MAVSLFSPGPCLSCIRRMTVSRATVPSTSIQIRGKKKLAKSPTINVQLLQNMPGFGRRGSIVPVAPGIMRNIWFPKKMAEYVTIARIQAVGRRNIISERDPAFPSQRERKLAKEKPEEEDEASNAALTEPGEILKRKPIAEPEDDGFSLKRSVLAEVDFLSPERAIEIMSSMLPPKIEFHRTPITPAPSAPKKTSPSLSPVSVVSKAAASVNEPSEPSTSIYGSVSTNDIAANLQSVLAEDSEGRRVVLRSDNIKIVGSEGLDRIKHIGDFEIEIRIDGSEDVVRRTVTVSAQG